MTTPVREALYGEFARYYDRIYAYKDHAAEVRFIVAAMRRYRVEGKDILDVACGTGRHAKLLVNRGYHVLGLDKHQEVLRIARKKVVPPPPPPAPTA